jgi:hypothetical protein
MSEFNGNIGEMEKFHPDNYPDMVTELSSILKGISHIPVYYKKDIVISYLKDNSIKTEWIAANPNLAALMTSGTFSTTHTETLFGWCRWNKAFRLELEQYIREKLN